MAGSNIEVSEGRFEYARIDRRERIWRDRTIF